MTLLLGCIADDFTGGTDLAGMLVKNGLRTVLMVGVPETPVPADIDAVVIALKSRTTPAADAIAQSLPAFHSLQAQGCRQIYFKYCSTFDSTPPFLSLSPFSYPPPLRHSPLLRRITMT